MSFSKSLGCAGAAALMVVAACAARAESDDALRAGLDSTESAETLLAGAQATPTAAEPATAEAAAHRSDAAAVAADDDAPTPAQALQRQTEAVRTSCFPPALVAVLDRMRAHFGAPVIVTSGYRSLRENRRAGGARRSLHTHCLAADVQIAGVRPSAIARFAKAQDDVGGVGMYRHTRSVHVDVGDRKMSWSGRRGRGHIRVALR